MKKSIGIIFLFFSIICLCSCEKKIIEDKLQTIQGKWKLVEFQNIDSFFIPTKTRPVFIPGKDTIYDLNSIFFPKIDLHTIEFFENNNPYHFIELNHKHLLGRAPQNKAEMLHHFTILQDQGYDAEIDSYLDSTEYQQRFGEEVVPYLNGWDYSAGQQGRQFSWLMQLARGSGASGKAERAGTNFRLGSALHQDRAIPVVSPNAGGSSGVQPSQVPHSSITHMAKGIGQKARVYRVEVTGLNNYQLHKRSNTVRFVPFNKLLETQQMIHRQGGRVASVTPVN